jgi:hypothetical protein
MRWLFCLVLLVGVQRINAGNEANTHEGRDIECLNRCKFADDEADAVANHIKKDTEGKKVAKDEERGAAGGGEHNAGQKAGDHGGHGGHEKSHEGHNAGHEGGHDGHEEEANLFELGDDLEVEYVAAMLVALMIFSMCCVYFLEKLREMTECWKHYRAVMDKVLEELAILGLISFALTMLESFGIVTHSKTLITFEFTHILIFIVAIILVIQALNVAAISIRFKVWWTRCHSSAKDPLFFENFELAYSKHMQYGNEDGSWGVMAALYNRICFAASYESAAVQWYLMR